MAGKKDTRQVSGSATAASTSAAAMPPCPSGSQRALQWLSRYLEQTRPRLVLDNIEQALFLSGYGERLSATYFGNWVAKTVKAADIGKQGSRHLFRHSCATHMLENGVDIRLV
ncbi:MAG: tyrosine-type recombinase/integrase [Verrucomicrobiae bacterium]|nr:tyrosine-type recombinase/integrase [Verrucomicrobiae bacterium]